MEFFDPQTWFALFTLCALEIILGVDNIIFLSISVDRLPPELRNKGRILGLLFAMLTRVLFLLSLTWVISLTKPLFILYNMEISGRSLILVCGGGFLLIKSIIEIIGMLKGPLIIPANSKSLLSNVTKFWPIIVQIAIIDIVFSLDSVITAVGLANEIWIMVLAIVIATIIMLICAKPIGEFIDAQPTIKMLALSFLVLVGVLLVGQGFNIEIPKSYLYVAMGFSMGVELLNLQLRNKILRS